MATAGHRSVIRVLDRDRMPGHIRRTRIPIHMLMPILTLTTTVRPLLSWGDLVAHEDLAAGGSTSGITIPQRERPVLPPGGARFFFLGSEYRRATARL